MSPCLSPCTFLSSLQYLYGFHSFHVVRSCKRTLRVFPSSLLILFTFPFDTPSFSRMFSMDCSVDGYLLCHCGGNVFSGTCNTSSLFFSDLCVWRTVSFTCSHSCFTAAVQGFLLFLKYISTEALPVPLVGSALAGFGSVRASSVSSTGQPCIPSQQGHPSSTSCYSNLDTCTQCRLEAR